MYNIGNESRTLTYYSDVHTKPYKRKKIKISPMWKHKIFFLQKIVLITSIACNGLSHVFRKNHFRFHIFKILINERNRNFANVQREKIFSKNVCKQVICNIINFDKFS